jgi:universal stress protein E
MAWEGRRFMGLDAQTSRILRERSRADAVARMKPLLKKIRVPASRRHLVAAEPISGISTVARATGSSIVVMGAVSRSGLKRLFIGNTAEQILDALECDVLVVKAPDFVSPVVSRRARGGASKVKSP